MASNAIVDVALPKTAITNASIPQVQQISQHQSTAKPVVRIFNEALLEQEHLGTTSRPLELLVALTLHVVLIGGPVLAGLYYTDTLDMRAFTTTLLVAPPPPPPPPAAPASAAIKAQPKRVFMSEGRLLAPTFIPKQVAQLKEAPLEAEMMDGMMGGVPGGVPGGQLGGVIGGIISSAQTHVPAPAPVTRPSGPIRAGGRVRPPQVITKVRPSYPELAKATHVRGVVEIDAVIDTDGSVIEMRAVSGHPLLIQAALDAVRKWKFEPTYLNDQPVQVQLLVTVTFQLEQ